MNYDSTDKSFASYEYFYLFLFYFILNTINFSLELTCAYFPRFLFNYPVNLIYCKFLFLLNVVAAFWSNSLFFLLIFQPFLRIMS